MTLEENITVIINKLKNNTGKMLSIEKRLKKLEEKEDSPCFESEGGFVPNEKFLSWYNGSFAPSEDDNNKPEILEETEEEETTTVHQIPEEVSPEVLEKLEEVTKDG